MKTITIFLFLSFVGFHSVAQNFVVKTNILANITTTINASAEMATGKNLTLSVDGNYNPWTFSNNRKWKHWMVRPELKYWFNRKFLENSVGVHLLGGQANIGFVNIPIIIPTIGFRQIKNNRYQGWFAGGGFTYNYTWSLASRLNLEFSLGLGYVYFDYDRFNCKTCGSWESSGVEHYFGPTKLAFNLVYVLW